MHHVEAAQCIEAMQQIAAAQHFEAITSRLCSALRPCSRLRLHSTLRPPHLIELHRTTRPSLETLSMVEKDLELEAPCRTESKVSDNEQALHPLEEELQPLFVMTWRYE